MIQNLNGAQDRNAVSTLTQFSSGINTTPRLDLDSKIAMLCSYYVDQKPEHRAKLLVQHPKAKGVDVCFKPGKVLADLIDFFLPASGPQKSLNDNQKALLAPLKWFQPWLHGIAAARNAGPDGEEPDLSEKVRLLCKAYATGPRPKTNETKTVTRDNGREYVLHGNRLLQKIAPNWFGNPTKHCVIDTEHKQAIEKLPWADAWLAVGRQRRDVARLGKIFTKQKKIDLLVQHYTTKPLDGGPAEKPSWNDILPQKVPGGGRWDFRPATFIDDLVGNWFTDDKPGVVLSSDQKAQLESLPWVHSWIENVRAARLRKQENNARKRKRPEEEDSGSEEESGSSQQSLAE